MIIMDEEFLVGKIQGFNLDITLPLRLQKRRLLEFLGFPLNKKLIPCLAREKKTVYSLFEKFSKDGFPFLIIVSEKPSSTLIPPLFTVKEVNSIIWRDNRGSKRKISYKKMMEVISKFPSSTWLEFSPYIWSKSTIAGRLVYINPDEQVIELQMGIIPRQLLTADVSPVFSGMLNYFDIQPQEYRKSADTLKNIGFKELLPYYVTRGIARSFGDSYFIGFIALAQVSSLPTLEFGVLRDMTVVFIDIDWPAQWKEV